MSNTEFDSLVKTWIILFFKAEVCSLYVLLYVLCMFFYMFVVCSGCLPTPDCPFT